MGSLADALQSRVRIVGVAAVAGAVGGVLSLAALALATGDAIFASRKTFALGALLMGFGLLGWSGSVLAGEGYESMQRHLDTGTNWTEESSRRAMARVGGFGAGWMVATAAVDAALV